MTQTKIQFKDIKVGDLIRTNASCGFINPTYTVGTVQCIHPDYICLKDFDCNLQLNQELRNKWNYYGVGCSNAWQVSNLPNAEYYKIEQKIAVHTPSKELWLKVAKASGKEWSIHNSDWENWNCCKEKSCINVDEKYLYYDDKQWFQNNGYTIISAEEYLKGKGEVSPIEVKPAEPKNYELPTNVWLKFNANENNTASNSTSSEGNSKKTIMSKILKFAKDLILSKREKLFRKHGLKDDCGNYTEEYWTIVKQQLCEAQEDKVFELVEKLEKE